MTARAEAVNTSTGEVLPMPGTQVAPFEMRGYLTALSGRNALADQNALAAAYDAACKGLIGPNDVQKAEGREFKKKSAWRKLARYFNISVELVRTEREVMADSHFLATVTARAVAPWGQSFEEIGACCTDEATGKRVISVADAIATAATRASNRAISNLIAMGEVSAEEIDKGGSRPRGPQAATATARASVSTSPHDFPMPFGKDFKNTPLGSIPTDKLESALTWAREKGKFEEFQHAAAAVLEEREPAERPARVTSGETGGIGIPLDDELPFD